jgi:hypothetical protein
MTTITLNAKTDKLRFTKNHEAHVSYDGGKTISSVATIDEGCATISGSDKYVTTVILIPR